MIIIILIILIILLFILYKPKKINNKSIDFVTITFNNKIEMDLLKLQAHSMKYVDTQFINQIIIIYNDTGSYNFTDVIKYYPKKLQNKVKIVNAIKLIPNYDKSSWHNQQLCKLLIAKVVKSNYYLILDGKNHFVKNINYSDYFNNGKPILFLNNPGTMIKFYYNCLKYFNINCPYNFNKDTDENIFLTTTPFLMGKKDVLDMMNLIEKRQNMSFTNFFKSKRNIITEFYIYIVYLIYTKRISNYTLRPKNYTSIMNDPTAEWNLFDKHKKELNKPHVKIFGLHRSALPIMNKEYKTNLQNLYKNYYSDDICKFINKNILQL